MCVNNANYLPQIFSVSELTVGTKLIATWTKLTMTSNCRDQNSVFAKKEKKRKDMNTMSVYWKSSTVLPLFFNHSSRSPFPTQVSKSKRL